MQKYFIFSEVGGGGGGCGGGGGDVRSVCVAELTSGYSEQW